MEPSCGDGSLLAAAVAALRARGATASAIAAQLQGVEVDAAEAGKAAQRLRALAVPERAGQIHVGDFFSYCQRLLPDTLLGTVLAEGRGFDAIIGNPPFIRYQSFPEAHRARAFALMQRAGLRPNRLTNAWAPFLVAASLALKPQGRLAMVIPAELLQVGYAAGIRCFLSEFFNEVTLVTFRQLVFADIQQEVVLLLAARHGGPRHDIRVAEVDSAADLADPQRLLAAPNGRKALDHSAEKWTLYFLSADEIALLRRLRSHPDLRLSGEAMSVDVGVVTGQNDFFLLRNETLEQYDLSNMAERAVSRSGHLAGARFRDGDWQRNVAQGHPTFLFFPPDVPRAALAPAAQRYVAQGEAVGVHQGYKCRIRRHWYRVPSVWAPDAFMLRQVHSFPKVVLNEAGATCTDTIHRVRFAPGVDGRAVTAAFLNSLTFAFAEITGRSYGGGVLTFEPSEAEQLPLPLTGAETLDLDHLDALLRHNDIAGALALTDATLLRQGLALDAQECAMLRAIWGKLRDRRIRRKHHASQPL